jgi:hypothetical protein
LMASLVLAFPLFLPELLPAFTRETLDVFRRCAGLEILGAGGGPSVGGSSVCG